MNDQTVARAHWSFWVIGVVAVIWNAMGVMNYFAQMDTEVLAQYSEAARATVEGRPAWATGGFAIAVFGGTIGGVLLLLRKHFAFYAFVVSLLGVIVTMTYTVKVMRSVLGFGPFQIFMYVVMPLIVATFFAWYARYAERKEWVD